MTDIEFVAQIVACIKVFDSPYQALEKARAYPVPHKSQKLKKRHPKIFCVKVKATNQTKACKASEL